MPDFVRYEFIQWCAMQAIELLRLRHDAAACVPGPRRSTGHPRPGVPGEASTSLADVRRSFPERDLSPGGAEKRRKKGAAVSCFVIRFQKPGHTLSMNTLI